MAPCQSRQLVICSLPFAVLVAFFWFRRRRSLSRSDPGGTSDKSTVDQKLPVGKELGKNKPAEKTEEICETVSVNTVKSEVVDLSKPIVESVAEEICKAVLVNCVKSEVVEEPVVVAVSATATESVPRKETVCNGSAVVVQGEADTCENKEQPISPTSEDSNIFHSTVIEDEKDIEKSDSVTVVQEENTIGEIEIVDLVQKQEAEEIDTSKTLDRGNFVEKTWSDTVEENLERDNQTVPFDEQSTIENIAVKGTKYAKHLEEEPILESSESTVSSEKIDIAAKGDSSSEDVENTSSDSGCPSSEDSANMAQGHKTEEKADNNATAAGLEQKLASLGLDTVQSAQLAQRTERDSANHSPAEVMLNSPAISTYSDAHSEGSSDSGKGCSDVVTPPSRTPAGGSSVAGDQVPSIFEFVLPQVIVGRLIGRHGAYLHDIRAKTHTNVFIKRHPETTSLKICAIEGTQPDIDAALKMIRQKFPLRRFPDLTLERVSFAKNSCLPINPDNLQLHLVEGVNNDVIVSSLITAGNFFLQLPMHMSYQSLYRLACIMNSVYNTQESPCLHEPQPDVVCVAPAHGGWYRAQILTVDKENDTSYVKFLDYGGYLTVENSTLRQIRGDFLLLPFQAVECTLANVVPAGGEEEWSEEAKQFVHQMTTQQTLQAQVYDYTETGLPMVYLYCTHFYHSPTDLGVYESRVVLLNEELVSRGFAELIDSTADDGETTATESS